MRNTFQKRLKRALCGRAARWNGGWTSRWGEDLNAWTNSRRGPESSRELPHQSLTISAECGKASGTSPAHQTKKKARPSRKAEMGCLRSFCILARACWLLGFMQQIHWFVSEMFTFERVKSWITINAKLLRSLKRWCDKEGGLEFANKLWTIPRAKAIIAMINNDSYCSNKKYKSFRFGTGLWNAPCCPLWITFLHHLQRLLDTSGNIVI